jgi:hypothetical protein
MLEKLGKQKGDSISLDEYQKIITEVDTLHLNIPSSPQNDQLPQEGGDGNQQPANNMLSENQRIIISIDQKVVDAIRYVSSSKI